MPRSPKNNQQLRDARRDAILRAAEQVFAKKGFTFAKISDIAKTAGLSHGLIYHYFDSKDALFIALIDKMMEEIGGAFDVESDTAYERLEQTLAQSFRLTQGNPRSMQLMTQAMLIGGLSDSLRECAFNRARGLMSQMKKLVKECQKERSITTDVDPGQLAAVLASVMRGMSIRAPGGQDAAIPMPTVETLMMLLRPHATPKALTHSNAVRGSRAPVVRPPSKRRAKNAKKKA